jgi:hypothetical protein
MATSMAPALVDFGLLAAPAQATFRGSRRSKPLSSRL